MAEDRHIDGNGWVDCGINTLTESPTPSDGVRGRFRIPSHFCNEFNIGDGDEIELRAIYNGKYVDYESDVYEDNGTIMFTLPLDKRRDLGLEVDDEVEYWVRPVTDDPDGQAMGENESADATSVPQRTLNDAVEETEGVGYVMHVTANGATLHAQENGAGETICGKQSEDANLTYPVDSPERIGGKKEHNECQRCAEYTGTRSIKDCREALSDRIEEIGYDPDDSNQGYYVADEQAAILEYIEELERRVEADGEAT